MSVLSKIRNNRLVKIQPKERLAATSELNLTSSLVTGCGEAKGRGYRAATQAKGLQSYYYHMGSPAFKWINRRSQKRSYNWSQFNRFLSFNPLPKSKIYHFYTLSKRRGCTSKEPDEGKPQVRFCEGAHSNLGANTPIGGGL